MAELTPQRVRELLAYDPEIGVLTWRVRVGNAFPVGKAAGGLPKKNGYVYVMIDGRNYRAHRIAWACHYGRWPTQIDHKNTNKADNRLENLREATKAQNAWNRGKYKKNTSGFKGVYKKMGGWSSQIKACGKIHYLGYFREKEAAAEAYRQAAVRLHGEFARVE